MADGKTLNTAVVIDTSASMTQRSYATTTQVNSNYFLGLLQASDNFGIVNYDTQAHFAYPTSGSLTTASRNHKTAANTKINGLAFDGGFTNIQDGIQKGRQLLDPVTQGVRGMVLLSDGSQNGGSDALSVLPAGYPIHTCAMGPNGDLNLMQQIAQRTGGVYYNAPYPIELSKIYNDIRALPPMVEVVHNQVGEELQPLSAKLIPITLSQTNQGAQFGFAWNDPNFTYTNSSNPGPNEISITLVDPNLNTLVNVRPEIVGIGYVVFNEITPQPGQWHLQIMYGSRQSQKYSAGAFEYTDGSSGAQVNFAGSGTTTGAAARGAANAFAPAANAAFHFDVNIMDKGEPIPNLMVKAEISAPGISFENAMRKFHGELSEISLRDVDAHRGESEDHIRLNILRERMLPQVDILAPKTFNIQLNEVSDSVYRGILENVTEKGDYNVLLSVTGHSPITNSSFQRSRYTTFTVD